MPESAVLTETVPYVNIFDIVSAKWEFCVLMYCEKSGDKRQDFLHGT